MKSTLIKDMVDTLNHDVVCNEYILEMNKEDIVKNRDYKFVEKYIKLFQNKKIDVKKENINELNNIIFKYNKDNEETIKIDSLWYINIKDNSIYFYSFEGFSEEFLDTYKKMKNCSFLRYLFDRYFEDNNEIKNIQDYIAIKLREYINFLADKIDKNINAKDCNQGQLHSNNLYDQVNYISTLTYEGSNVSAKIVLLKESLFSEYIDFYIQLEEPIKFEEYRKVRKLLETSDKTTYLIGDNEKIHGIGRLKNISKFKDDMDVFVIDFIGRFEYKINTFSCNFSTVREDINRNKEVKEYSLRECNLVNVRYGKPDLKEYRYSESDFCGAIKTIFKDDNDKKIELLKKIVSYAKDQKHGTTIVITTPEIARREVLKLHKQSIKIKEKELKDDEYLKNIINRITNIDGALYLDITGKCHAIGVILDGDADNKHGDASRGARFNSAIKYSLKSDLKKKCIIVVMSEDGMVNIIYNGNNYKEEKKINELFNEAEKLYYNQEFKKFIEKTNEILEIDKNNEKAYMGKGLAYKILGKNKEAVKYYDKAIELNPDYKNTYNNKGNALHELGKYDEAIECYDKAIELNPEYVFAYNNKGNALQQLGKYDEAIEYYDKAIELNPEYGNAYNNKGDALQKLGKYDEAIEYYDKAIELNPDCGSVYNNKGNALLRLEKYDEAIECCDKAIELNPDSAFAYNNKGNTLLRLEKYDEAIEYYDKAIELNPNYGNFYNNKRNALEALGQNEEAEVCYQKYNELADIKYNLSISGRLENIN
ncbi:tetratricopeptide repeat protein [Clostridium sporogenes]|uniref:tetratricopeptide repeat protein n=1 Tax=Clostridium sporogenes TaxID=1509 RepID=UPI0022378BBE|nr:tetratricopeptide repeat protein [Clostridium sporogenes]MCW6110084.1 tetratricopeptide repeat protein [Clostridium sporogenes]